MDVIELELLAKCIQGDLDAFGVLINKYSIQVYNTLHRILGNEEDAQDVSQEVFIKIYKNMHTFKGKSEFSTWLYRITINCAKDFNKKKKIDLLIDDTKDIEQEFSYEKSSNPEAAIEEVEKRELVLKELMKLKKNQRMIIVLRDIQGLSYEEISKVLSISIGTVKSRINRARIQLRQALLETPFDFKKGGH
ncbi:sigma-70 family RNA polymerase sigma factor [Alkalibaculum sp. M08DMB]|uniref:Sigma-70 family RNA polymerase sigma factor n=1 Tax=Alkalibaculum sporogenes TaxID=2655001 RepID=A0A6A7K5G2_9FIRM|nr:sigma-70 family RNA polymerase sigma factor [Alkalibaculum sporogenes]MPW24584.1 sigma-70 family RNA polymerase sigma factor [Alkalibaculum sporogenes]